MSISPLTTYSSGTKRLFRLKPNSTILNTITIKKRYDKNAFNLLSGHLYFLECTNLHNVPQYGNRTMLAFCESEEHNWYLGCLIRAPDIHNRIKLLKFTGKILDLLPTETTWTTISRHFEYIEISVEKKNRFVFVNCLNKKTDGSNKIHLNLINRIDNGIQCNTEGPDLMLNSKVSVPISKWISPMPVSQDKDILHSLFLRRSRSEKKIE